MKKILQERHDISGGIDIIGDVHGCMDELRELLLLLGYNLITGLHPEGRTAVFVGDLTDRGPDPAEVLRLVLWHVRYGIWHMVMGNHDTKLLSHLQGNIVSETHGFLYTKEVLASSFWSTEFLDYRTILQDIPLALSLDSGKLIVVHGGYMVGLHDPNLKYKIAKWATCYGMPTGELTEDGYPVRREWAKEYAGPATVVYGHTPHETVQRYPFAINIDTGCCFGGSLTALRWPSLDIVSVESRQPKGGMRSATCD